MQFCSYCHDTAHHISRKDSSFPAKKPPGNPNGQNIKISSAPYIQFLDNANGGAPLDLELSPPDARLSTQPPHRVRSWHSRQGSNLQPAVLETAVPSLELREYKKPPLESNQPCLHTRAALQTALRRHITKEKPARFHAGSVDAHPAGGIMETGVRIMWPPVRAEVVRTGKDTLPLYTQPQAGCQPMRQVVAASGEQRHGAPGWI